MIQADAAVYLNRALLSWQSVRPYFNLGAQDNRQRIVAYGVLTIALGIIALWGARFGGPLDIVLGWVPLMALVWVTAPSIEASMCHAIERRPFVMLAAPISVWAVIIVMQDPTASDDLLRHLAAWAFHYDYSSMFLYSTIPSPSLYPLFDHAVGPLAQQIGMVPAMHVVQLAALVCVLGPIVALVIRHTEPGPARGTIIIVALTMGACLSLGRIALGRPEVFLTGWVIAALLPHKGISIALWMAAGLALSASHVLAPVYFAAVVLLPVALRVRIAVASALLTFHAVFWWIYSEGHYFDWLAIGAKALANRQADIEENMTIGMALFRWPVLVCIAGILWTFKKGRPADAIMVLAVAAWFILSGQIRYSTTVGLLLLAFLIVAMPKDNAVLRSARWRLAIWSYAAIVLVSTAMRLPTYDGLVRFELPAGARVLTGMGANFSVIFHNAGKVRVAPALELGATDAEVQHLAFDLDIKGKLDCAALQRFDFTEVVEDSLLGPPPPCLKLEQTQGKWRAWSVQGH